jgi:hypothetical protein
MNTHRVTLNGQAVAIGSGNFRLLTMVLSCERHDQNGNKVTTHELAMDAADAYGKEATQFCVPPVPLKKGDVIQVVIGETHDT